MRYIFDVKAWAFSVHTHRFIDAPQIHCPFNDTWLKRREKIRRWFSIFFVADIDHPAEYNDWVFDFFFSPPSCCKHCSEWKKTNPRMIVRLSTSSTYRSEAKFQHREKLIFACVHTWLNETLNLVITTAHVHYLATFIIFHRKTAPIYLYKLIQFSQLLGILYGTAIAFRLINAQFICCFMWACSARQSRQHFNVPLFEMQSLIIRSEDNQQKPSHKLWPTNQPTDRPTDRSTDQLNQFRAFSF